VGKQADDEAQILRLDSEWTEAYRRHDLQRQRFSGIHSLLLNLMNVDIFGRFLRIEHPVRHHGRGEPRGRCELGYESYGVLGHRASAGARDRGPCLLRSRCEPAFKKQRRRAANTLYRIILTVVCVCAGFA
jgi:hypothetical protein